MNFSGFLGVLASVSHVLSLAGSSIIEALPQSSLRKEPILQNSPAITSPSLHSARFATLTKLPGFADKRYALANGSQLGFTPRDGWQTLLEEFTRPQLAVQVVGQKFQVKIKGHVVAEVTSQDQAALMVWQLQRMALNPDFDAQNLHLGLSLRPGMPEATPVGKIENEVLFWSDRRLTPQVQENAELTAIAWVNNLRAALDVPRLSLAEAQSQMHNLVPTDQRLRGTASWYGSYFHGRQTATGEIFDQNDLTAAHPSLPFGTFLKVTNLLSGEQVIVRINDRGPYWDDRSLDLSRQAALCLNSESKGVVPYEAIVMQPVQPMQTLKNTASISQEQHPDQIRSHRIGQKVARLIRSPFTQSGQPKQSGQYTQSESIQSGQ
ncbi:MAG: septal ring lytic transglycosylase RlpA family protein [Timaviella obliquedivisa GSE-PSE-MK23-08B]|jgi:rare lipoprotein A (peptidoglycan hydrolase)|nr:septal ring lytic transglycosylase RlpA family protein [Timaviella obliquedivisa GSE-PSE-MK23-08B]